MLFEINRRNIFHFFFTKTKYTKALEELKPEIPIS